MKAVALARREKPGFLLAVGGGSVLDGTKFVAAALEYAGADPWDILEKHARVEKAVPLGDVLTLPATGSEMNGNAVISRVETRQKLGFGSDRVLPLFSILDPETTLSLPPRQTANGIVDTMVHVFEQYLTRDAGNPLNEGIAEAILRAAVDGGKAVFVNPKDYDARANLMWAATMALNGLIGLNAAHDWTSHDVGHELTAFHGLDHGQTLAVVSPNVLRYEKDKKKDMLVKYARNVWRIAEADEGRAALLAVDRTVEFWNSIGVKTRLSDYGVGDANFEKIAERLCGGGRKMGENGDIGKNDVLSILRMCV
jgi:NADP-dependent alcohol dehydrogenase